VIISDVAKTRMTPINKNAENQMILIDKVRFGRIKGDFPDN